MKRLNNRGDTLLESLVAFTIVCVAMILLANVISSSSYSVNETKRLAERYQETSNKYWTNQASKESKPVQLNFGSFIINANFDTYTVDNETFYEFSKSGM